jgi:hypothetical protein
MRYARLAIPHVCGCFFGVGRNDEPQARKQNTKREQPGNNFSFEHLFTPFISFSASTLSGSGIGISEHREIFFGDIGRF